MNYLFKPLTLSFSSLFHHFAYLSLPQTSRVIYILF